MPARRRRSRRSRACCCPGSPPSRSPRPTRSPAARSPARRTPPCVTGQWIVGAARVLAGGAPVVTMTGPVDLRADRHAADARRRADARAGDLRRDRSCPTSTFPTTSPASAAPRRPIATTISATSSSRCCSPRPGERVMRPDFGAACWQLVFEPNSATLAATTQMLVQSSLQLHLSHLIAVKAVEVEQRRRGAAGRRPATPCCSTARSTVPPSRRRGATP